MTAQQKIDRLMARVSRLQAQANATANATAYAVADEDQKSAMADLESIPAAAATYIADAMAALPEVAIAAALASVEAAPAAKSSYFASSCGRAVAAAKSAVVGAGTIVKQAAVAVCWTAPKWLATTTARISAAVYGGVVAAAPTVRKVGLFGLQFAIVLSAIVAVGSVLFSPFGLSMFIGGCGIGFLGYLAVAQEERRAARYAQLYA